MSTIFVYIFTKICIFCLRKFCCLDKYWYTTCTLMRVRTVKMNNVSTKKNHLYHFAPPYFARNRHRPSELVLDFCMKVRKFDTRFTNEIVCTISSCALKFPMKHVVRTQFLPVKNAISSEWTGKIFQSAAAAYSKFERTLEWRKLERLAADQVSLAELESGAVLEESLAIYKSLSSQPIGNIEVRRHKKSLAAG